MMRYAFQHQGYYIYYAFLLKLFGLYKYWLYLSAFNLQFCFTKEPDLYGYNFYSLCAQNGEHMRVGFAVCYYGGYIIQRTEFGKTVCPEFC